MNITISVKSTGNHTAPNLQCLVRCLDRWQAFNKPMTPGWRSKNADGQALTLDEQPEVHAFVQECLADFIDTQLQA